MTFSFFLSLAFQTQPSPTSIQCSAFQQHIYSEYAMKKVVRRALWGHGGESSVSVSGGRGGGVGGSREENRYNQIDLLRHHLGAQNLELEGPECSTPLGKL